MKEEFNKDTKIMQNQIKTQEMSQVWWLTPIILATQDAEIRRITV
jgi:hypothetical protein